MNEFIFTVKTFFTEEAELLNGRVAMVALLLGVLTEAITGVGILGQLGSLF